MAGKRVTRIDLLRHGEPEGGPRYRGQVDDPLNETGWSQMWRAVGQFDEWGQIVCSPLSRCSAFAHALSENYEIPVAIEDRIKEIGFGCWEGKTKEQLISEDPGQLDRFYRQPLTSQPQGAEPIPDFYARVSRAFDEWVDRYRGQHILAVTHAGVMRAIVAHVLQTPLESMYSIKVPYAGITRIDVQDNLPPALVFHARSSL